MSGVNLAGGDAQPSASSRTRDEASLTKRPRKSRDRDFRRGWIAPRYLPRSTSVRKTSSARSLSYANKSDISQVRPAWVPAPARSTSSGLIGDNFAASPSSAAATSSHQLPVNPRARSSPSPPPIQEKSPKASGMASGSGNVRPSSSRSLLQSALNTIQSQGKDRYYAKRPTSKVKSSKYGGRKKTSGYTTLQSKDSLVDVTACLQEKRQQVMKLWQNTLLNDDPTLISNIEIVNKLALEAAQEVEFLRKSIQSLQKKTDGLSEEDCTRLNELRGKVLSKVWEFEQADKDLHAMIVRKSSSKASIASASATTSKTSQTHQASASASGVNQANLPQEGLLSSHSLKDIVFVHQQPAADHSDDSQSEHDEVNAMQRPLSYKASPSPSVVHFKPAAITYVHKEFPNPKQRPSSSKKSTPAAPVHHQPAATYSEDSQSDQGEVITAMQRPFSSDKSTLASAVPSMENLSQLKLLYQENLTFPPLPQGIKLSRSQSYNQGLDQAQHAQQRKIRFETERTRSSQPSQSDGDSQPESTDELYQGKISHLRRKLLDTEQEVEELKSDMERIESDANFRVKMLHNTVQDKFDSLKVIPDYLQMVDVKLSESVQLKGQLQRDLTEKERFLQKEKELTRSLRKETEELRAKLLAAETMKELQAFKNSELERCNLQLRKEAEEATKKRAEMANHIQRLKDTQINFPSPPSPRVSAIENQNQKLKFKCLELKEELGQSKRIIQMLKKSKAKLASDLNEKIEELIQALQTAQNHKRILGDQIHQLKKSYHELFPCDCEPHAYVPHKCSALHKPKRKPKPKSNKNRKEMEPVEEPIIEAKEAWRTGERTLIDNFFDLPFDFLTINNTTVD